VVRERRSLHCRRALAAGIRGPSCGGAEVRCVARCETGSEDEDQRQGGEAAAAACGPAAACTLVLVDSVAERAPTLVKLSDEGLKPQVCLPHDV